MSVLVVGSVAKSGVSGVEVGEYVNRHVCVVEETVEAGQGES